MELGTETRKSRHPFLTGLDRLASNTLGGLVLFAAAAVYIGMSAGQEAAYRSWIRFVFSNPPGILLTGLFVLNLVARLIRHLIDAVRPGRALSGPEIRADDHVVIENLRPDWKDAITGWIASRKYPLFSPARGTILGLKGRWSVLPRIIALLGLSLVLAGVFVSQNFRQRQHAVVFKDRPGRLFDETVTLVEIEHDLPSSHLQIGKEHSFSLDRVDAVVQLGDRNLTVNSRWPTGGWGSYFKITGFGPVTDVRPKGSRAPGQNQQLGQKKALNVFPPGRSDVIRIGGREVNIALAPSRKIKKGRLEGDVYDLLEPLYRLTVGTEPVSEGGKRAPETGSPADAPVFIESAGFWVAVEAVRDPGLPVLTSGLWILAAGLLSLCANLFWYRREIIVLEDGKQVVIGTRSQILKKWGVYRFYGWKEELRTLLSPGNQTTP